MLNNEVYILILIGVIIYLIYMSDSKKITPSPVSISQTSTPMTVKTSTQNTKTAYSKEEEAMAASSKLPDNIKNILLEIRKKTPMDKNGSIIPSNEDLNILIDAIIKEVGNTKMFVEKINNLSKNKNSMAQISQKEEELFRLIVGIYFLTKGVVFSEEIAPLLKNNNTNF
jgi:hypothetical protein